MIDHQNSFKMNNFFLLIKGELIEKGGGDVNSSEELMKLK